MITGIILTGGKSQRMGKEKGLCHFRGLMLVEYAIKTLLPLCDELILSANNKLDEYRQFGYPVVSDILPDSGPIGGLYSGLLASKTELNLVISCDTPFVTTALFTELIKHINNFQSVVPIHETKFIEPLTACYKKSCLPIIKSQIETGHFKMTDLLDKLNTHYLEVNATLPEIGVSMFHNLNTPEDLLSC